MKIVLILEFIFYIKGKLLGYYVIYQVLTKFFFCKNI